MRETIVDRAYAKTLLPPRKEDGHKGDFGKLLVLTLIHNSEPKTLDVIS